jgi:WD40 repeat protein
MRSRTLAVLLVLILALIGLAAPVPGPRPVQPDPLPPGALACLGSARLRHSWTVHTVAFSADGKLLASAGEETGGGGSWAVRIWQVPSGREVRCIWLGYRAVVRRVALSPDGSLVAWSGAGAGVAVADVATGRVIDRLDKSGGKDTVRPFAFSPDGKALATGAAGTLRLWDLTTGKETLEAKVGDFDRCLFSPDGRKLAIVAGKFAGLRLIDVAPGSATRGKPLSFPVVRPGPLAVAFSPDGSHLAGGDDNLVRLWDVATGKEVRRLDWEGRSACAVAFDADGRTVAAVARDGQVRVWQVATGKQTEAFRLPFQPGDREPAARLAFSPGRRWLAAAPPGKVIRLVLMQTGREVNVSSTMPGSHFSFAYAFSPDGKHLVTPSSDDRLLVWEARTGRLVARGVADTRSVYWLAVSADAKRILSLSYNRSWAAKVRLDEWDFASCKRLRQVVLGVRPGHVALSPDGKLLACGEPNDVRYRAGKTGEVVLLDRTTGKPVRHLDDGRAAAPQALVFSPDGGKVATVCKDGVIRLWDVGTGKLVRSMNTGGQRGLYYQLRFVNGGKGLVSVSMSYEGGRRVARIVEWDPATGKPRQESAGPADLYWCQALSPDGKLLAWSGRMGAGRHEDVEVWDVSAGRVRQRFEGLRGGAAFLLFAPDGRTLASGCRDDTILIWDVGAKKE